MASFKGVLTIEEGKLPIENIAWLSSFNWILD
jgi:hypothetical protein